jgi:uncharacterized damage-inducible protein DinB
MTAELRMEIAMSENIASIVDSDHRREPWSQRTFVFSNPPWMLADLTERLRGLHPRLLPLLRDLSLDDLRRQVDGSWSIAQNVGHLADVEDLWQERLDDLRRGRPVYSPADPARFRAAAQRHQGRSIDEILTELQQRRAILIDAFEHATPELRRASAYHERLRVPMRLVDCAQFYAEHDDHHLLRIRALVTMFLNDPK